MQLHDVRSAFLCGVRARMNCGVAISCALQLKYTSLSTIFYLNKLLEPTDGDGCGVVSAG